MRLFAQGILSVSLLFTAISSHAGKEEFASREALVTGIMSKNVVTRQQAEKIVDGLATANKGQLPKIKSTMFIRGMEFTFFFHQGYWNVRQLDVYDNETQKWIDVDRPYLYQVYYQNGGVAISLAYKWLWLFFTEDLSVDELNGAEYGGMIFNGGLGLQADLLTGIDFQIMSGRNRPGMLFVIGPAIGVGGGVRFPNMTFIKKNLN